MKITLNQSMTDIIYYDGVYIVASDFAWSAYKMRPDSCQTQETSNTRGSSLNNITLSGVLKTWFKCRENKQLNLRSPF